jgi:hypothetical protein
MSFSRCRKKKKNSRRRKENDKDPSSDALFE